MGLRSKILTDQEKTAIVALVYGFVPSWKEAYRIADGMSDKEAAQNIHFADYTSKWKTSAKVQLYLQTVLNQKAVQENDLLRKFEKEMKYSGDNERTENKKQSSFIDYADPVNQRRKLNELINEASDPGEALDALKVIISGQKDDRQAAREQRQVRAYLPLACSDCPLYQKANKKS